MLATDSLLQYSLKNLYYIFQGVQILVLVLIVRKHVDTVQKGNPVTRWMADVQMAVRVPIVLQCARKVSAICILRLF
jgi:hypothetical protein